MNEEIRSILIFVHDICIRLDNDEEYSSVMVVDDLEIVKKRLKKLAY